MSCYGIQVPRSNLICYLLLCLIILTDQDMDIISEVLNSIEHPMLEPKKDKEKGGFWPLVQILKKRVNVEDAWSGVV